MTTTIYDQFFQKYGAAYLPQIDYRWLKAQGMAESALNPLATSPVGAVGIMQIMPDTGEQIAGEFGDLQWDLTDAETSIRYGCHYMRDMWDFWTSKRSDMDHLRLAQASYNAGSGNLFKAQRLAGGALDYATIVSFLPKVTGHENAMETTYYVINIAKNYAQLCAETQT